ncbi:hypothetical protein HPB49_004559 [Dermacentor silvarum]|uniref:Uncharacterized protein n=1 Tax=Dermacentor silvarum TaxID=543639 RepID=A0ACB8DAU5_DERSI|nr:hypothetical protein HPB49_004559 [Dermacentor silvarum]
MPDYHFRQHFRLSKETVRLLCEELPGELKAVRATGLPVERKVLCPLRFATGSFQASVGSEETIRVSQSTVSECVRRVAEAVVNAGARNNFIQPLRHDPYFMPQLLQLIQDVPVLLPHLQLHPQQHR